MGIEIETAGEERTNRRISTIPRRVEVAAVVVHRLARRIQNPSRQVAATKGTRTKTKRRTRTEEISI
jgi:hypothetical protein